MTSTVPQPSRAARIATYRRRQPIAELERKAAKARGRQLKGFWIQEEIDLVEARADVIWRKLPRSSPLPSAPTID